MVEASLGASETWLSRRRLGRQRIHARRMVARPIHRRHLAKPARPEFVEAAARRSASRWLRREGVGDVFSAAPGPSRAGAPLSPADPGLSAGRPGPRGCINRSERAAEVSLKVGRGQPRSARPGRHQRRRSISDNEPGAVPPDRRRRVARETAAWAVKEADKMIN